MLFDRHRRLFQAEEPVSSSEPDQVSDLSTFGWYLTDSLRWAWIYMHTLSMNLSNILQTWWPRASWKIFFRAWHFAMNQEDLIVTNQMEPHFKSEDFTCSKDRLITNKLQFKGSTSSIPIHSLDNMDRSTPKKAPVSIRNMRISGQLDKICIFWLVAKDISYNDYVAIDLDGVASNGYSCTSQHCLLLLLAVLLSRWFAMLKIFQAQRLRVTNECREWTIRFKGFNRRYILDLGRWHFMMH